MSAPLVVNTKDGTCWTRRTVTTSGLALYAPEGVCKCPEFVMATLAELAEHGIAGSADALPMPVGRERPERLTAAERDMILGLIADAKPASSGLLLSFAESVHNRRKHEHPQREDWYCLNLSAYMGERSGPVLRRLVDVEVENEGLRARVAEAVATVARLEQKRVELERIANAERERVAELEAAAPVQQRQGYEAAIEVMRQEKLPMSVGLLEAQLELDKLDGRVPPLTVFRAEHPDSGIVLGHYGTAAAARAHCEATERRSWPAGTTLSFDWIRDALAEDEENGVAELVVTAGQNEESVTGYIVTALEVPSEYDE